MRAELYRLRLEHAQQLLRKEADASNIRTALIGADNFPPGDNTDSRGTISRRWAVDKAFAERWRAIERSQTIADRFALVRGEIEAGKVEIAKRKAVLAQRRADLYASKIQLAESKKVVVDKLVNENKQTVRAREHLHSKSAYLRMERCYEAAMLYGVKVRKRRRKTDVSFSEYVAGSVGIMNLRDMNSEI